MPFVIPKRTIALLTLLVLGIMGAGLAYVYLPQASVVLTPAVTDHVASQEIVLSRSVQEPDFKQFLLPARVIEESVTIEKTIERTGSVTTEDFAQGTITLHNEQAEPQSLLPGTHVQHEASGLSFTTNSPVTIPAESTTSVAVTAKEKGVAGNVPPGRFVVEKLPASLQPLVYGESSVAFSGGTRVDTPLDEAEIEEARAGVIEAAQTELRGRLTAASGGAPLREDLVAIEQAEEHVSADPGSTTTEFTIRTTFTGRAFLVDEKDILSLTLLALRSHSTPEAEFVRYDPASFQFDILQHDVSRGEARVKSSLTGTFAYKVSPAALVADNLAGRSRNEVLEHYRQFSSVGTVDVSFWPFWVNRVPSRESAVEVVIKNNP